MSCVDISSRLRKALAQNFGTLAECNLTVHDGNVHYVENPPVSTKFKPYNPDL